MLIDLYTEYTRSYKHTIYNILYNGDICIVCTYTRFISCACTINEFCDLNLYCACIVCFFLLVDL